MGGSTPPPCDFLKRMIDVNAVYDDEDNAPMNESVDTKITFVWKTLEDLGFTKSEVKAIRSEKENMYDRERV